MDKKKLQNEIIVTTVFEKLPCNSNAESDLKFDFTCSRPRMRFSFGSEGPKPTKTPFKQVYLNIKVLKWLARISELSFGIRPKF